MGQVQRTISRLSGGRCGKNFGCGAESGRAELAVGNGQTQRTIESVNDSKTRTISNPSKSLLPCPLVIGYTVEVELKTCFRGVLAFSGFEMKEKSSLNRSTNPP